LLLINKDKPTGMLPKNWSSFYERITESKSIFFKEFSHEKEV